MSGLAQLRTRLKDATLIACKDQALKLFHVSKPLSYLVRALRTTNQGY